jgi:GntR family transcriptional regulator
MITVERGGLMNLSVSMYSEKPIYEQLKDQLKEAVLNGSLKVHQQLPSIRTVSKDLQIGIVTVKRAYDDLVKEGFFLSQAGRGYFVLDINLKKIQEDYKKKIEEHVKEIVRLKNEAGLDKEIVMCLLMQEEDEHNE